MSSDAALDIEAQGNSRALSNFGRTLTYGSSLSSQVAGVHKCCYLTDCSPGEASRPVGITRAPPRQLIRGSDTQNTLPTNPP